MAMHLKQDGGKAVDGVNITMGVAEQGVGDLGEDIGECPAIGSPNLAASLIFHRELVNGLLARD